MDRKSVYALVAVFVISLGLAVGNVVYTNRVNQQAERRNVERARDICGLLVVLDDAYGQTPPTTQLGRNIADEIHRYRVRLGC